MHATRVLALGLAVVALSWMPARPADADPPATGTIRITPTIDPPGQTGGQAVPHGSTFKVRDADGNVVAEGGIDGSGGNRGNYQTGEVDLPPGEYTVEIRYHTPGDRHSEGTRDYKGTKKVTVRPGRTALHQIEVEPRNPEQHLGDRIQDVEDLVDEKEAEIEDLEEDIRNHRRNGEPVGDEHTDMLDDLEDDLDSLKDRLRRMRRELRAMRAARLGGGGKGAANAVKDAVKPVPRMPQGQKSPGPKY